MINSVINDTELNNNGKIINIKNINGENIDTVRMFDEDLDIYIPDLMCKLNVWRKKSIEERLDAILSIKQNLEDENLSKILIKSICSEIGKPLPEAESEIDESISLIDFFLNNISEESFLKRIEIDSYYKTKTNYIRLSPLGIVGIIKPWNYPVTNSLWSIIPALLVGNIVIYKPSEYCCKTAKILSDIILNSRLPKGVFNILFGDKKTGQRMIECKDLSMISFTGSSKTAIDIQKHAIESGIIRKYSIESGGSDFAIVDKDVNIDFASDGIIWGAFNNSGQVCTSIENVLIPKEIYPNFVEMLKKKASKLKAGKDYGKIQNASLEKKIREYLDVITDDETSQIIFGGIIDNGYLAPTLIECSKIENANIELFSNILRIFSYSNKAELCNMINSSKYGLGCTIWTNQPNSTRIKEIIEDVNIGMIWINDVNIAFPEMPWGGVKNSGIGINLSLNSLREFSYEKSVSIDTDNCNQKEWWYPYEDWSSI